MAKKWCLAYDDELDSPLCDEQLRDTFYQCPCDGPKIHNLQKEVNCGRPLIYGDFDALGICNSSKSSKGYGHDYDCIDKVLKEFSKHRNVSNCKQIMDAYIKSLQR